MSSSPPPPPSHRPSGGTPITEAAQLPRLRVLIVDDQVPVLVALSSLLTSRGYEAVTADSGATALAKLRQEYFDVLLCDVRMPEMSGLEVLSEALRMDADLPVLMLTGVNDVATAREALARGAMDYLTKPIELDALDKSVRSAANERREKALRRHAQSPQPVDKTNQ